MREFATSTERLAYACSRCAELRESSFRVGHGHSVSIEHAAEIAAREVGEEKLARPIYLLMEYAWNDTLDWAESIG